MNKCLECNTPINKKKIYCTDCMIDRRRTYSKEYARAKTHRGMGKQVSKIDPKWLVRGTPSGGHLESYSGGM